MKNARHENFCGDFWMVRKILVLALVHIRSNLTFFLLTKYSLSTYYVLGLVLAPEITVWYRAVEKSKVRKEVWKWQQRGWFCSFTHRSESSLTEKVTVKDDHSGPMKLSHGEFESWAQGRAFQINWARGTIILGRQHVCNIQGRARESLKMKWSDWRYLY